MLRLASILLMLTAAGCNTPSREKPLSTDHPANPEANIASYAEPRSRLLALDNLEPVMPARGESPAPEHHRPNDMSEIKHAHASTHSVQHSDTPASQPSLYVCPMHPEVTSTEPGQRCPKCGMKLVLKKENGE